MGGQYFALHKKIYEWFDIQFDYFGRTSCEDPATNLDWPQTKVLTMFAAVDMRVVERGCGKP